MDSPYKSELLVAINAVQHAARLSKAVLVAKDKGVVSKDDLSPVTVADFAIQALLTASIHAAFPSDKFVGEESSGQLRQNPALLDRVWGILQEIAGSGSESGSGETSDVTTATSATPSKCITIPPSKEEMCTMIDWAGSGVPDSGRTWVFDPIDGTETFVRGEMFAINCAMLENGRQVLGVVGAPLLALDAQAPLLNGTVDRDGHGCILFGVHGHGAWIRPLEGTVEEAPARRLPRLDITSVAQLKCVTCYSTVHSGIANIHESVAAKLGTAFPGNDLVSWVIRWSVAALGHGNMAVWVYKKRTRYAKIWDHAGAMLLFQEVGGRVTDVDGREIDWTTGRKMTRNYGFVAAPEGVHAEVLRAVQEVMREEGMEVFELESRQ